MESTRIMIKDRWSIGLHYDENDFQEMKKIYKKWIDLNKELMDLGSRSMNVPDLLSEGLFAYLFDVYRTNGEVNGSGYDAYDVKTNAGIQIKSCSIDNDCTSFGPRTRWDRIYFMRFYPESEDGKVEIYDITSFDLEKIVLNTKKDETFKDQQMQGRRPRLSIQRQIIDKYNLKPIRVVKLLEK